MSLASQVTALSTRIASEFKTLRTTLGNNADLNTAAKSTLVGAINEVKTGLGSAGAQINDAAPSTSSVYSSSKTDTQVAGLINDVTPSASKVYSSTKSSAVATAAAAALIDDATASGTKTYSSTKTLAEILALIADGSPGLNKTYSSTKINAVIAALINDAAPSTTKVYSSTKTEAQITAAVNALIGGAPAAWDTFKEIADYITADQSGAAAMNTAIGNRVRFDAAQALTGPEKTQALTNIGAAPSADLGDPATDFVAAFNAALV